MEWEKLIEIGKIKERHGDKYPALSDCLLLSPIPDKDRVLQYLKRGEVIGAFAGLARDCLTGERIPGEYLMLSDGVYAWDTAVTYYFERYNLRLPEDFITRALSAKDPALRRRYDKNVGGPFEE